MCGKLEGRGKMGRLPGRFVAIVVVLALIDRVSTTEDRDTVSKAAEVLMNEGDALKVECIGSPNVDSIVYPKDLGDAITTSTPDMSGVIEDGVYKYQFHRRHTVHGDTGLYGCPYHPIEVTTGNVTKSYLEFVYVYVQSNTNVFVQADTFVSLREAVGGTTIIPCKPTSPNFTVHLWFDDTHERNEPFDPRIGFTLTNLTLRDSGYFKCVIERDDMVHEVNYHLLVLRKQMLKEPKIMENSLRHVTRGQTLRVNCTTEVDADMQYVFNWSTPFQSSRISTRLTSKKFGPVQHIANELIIEDVKDEDKGWYECSITSFYDTRKTKKYIRIHDPENKFINLTAQDSDRHYQRREGDKVQWVVDVNAYPQPDLKWLNTKGEEIVGNWDSVDKVKYAVQMTPSLTILRINHLNIDDMGEYSLQATNPDRIEMLNFTLDVLVRPVPMLRVEPYYKPNQEVEIACDVATFPSPNITWTFLKCPYFPSYEDANVEELTNTKESGMGTRFRSTVKTTIEVSGHLTCIACNIIGCESQTEVILVSDVRGGFGIIEPKGNITEGDDLELICAASVYNYTNYFEWKYVNNTPITQSKRLTIVETKTPFTYRSILKIKNVTKEDSTTYTCSNKEEMDFFLRVYGAKAPYMMESNLYKNETTIDFNTEGHKTVILKCYVGGMPRPKVTWHKDDVQIENTKSDQYMCVNNCQEMHINYLRENDSGKFSCRIENRFGSLESYVVIVVKGKELPRELIALIVILVVTVIALFIYFTIKVRREKIMRKELMEAGLMHFEEGAVECLNPDLTVDDQAELLPYDKKWEFPREKLKLGKQLGSGAFGVVMKAEAEGICESETITTVAVKMVRRTTDPTYVRALASELKIMVHLGKHLNVVNLLGACTKNISKRELLVIVEYCRFGNLHNYLLRHRTDFINQIDPATGKFDPNIGLDLLTRSFSVSSNNRIKYAVLSFSRSLSGNSGTDSANCQTSPMDSQGVSMSPDGCVLSNNSIQPGWRSNYRGDYKDHNLKPICTQDLLSWAFQVARGMEYLSQRKVLHGDLAARNILLAEDNVVKICDFGMAKTIYKDNNYKKKGDGLLPIKWMAIESIRDQIFSTQSDIWSFGIILWEFFTLAETPYPGMGAEKQYQKLIEGYRMEQPEYATTEVYDIMLQCWKAKPTLRPSFTELVDSIGNLLEDSVKSHYISLNDPYLDMNTTLLEGGRSDYLTMLSAPDHTTLSSPGPEYTNLPSSNPPDSAYLCMSPVSQRDESGIFSPRPELLEQNHFEFPSPTSDTEDAELSPMLKKEADNDPYLKPIDVNKRRAEFIRQRQAATTKNQASGDRPIDRDPGYCNAPRNLPLTELTENNDKSSNNETDSVDQSNNENSLSKKDYVPTIIRTPDNYVNMPKQKSDLRIDMPDGFSNPSYVLMSNRGVDQTRV